MIRQVWMTSMRRPFRTPMLHICRERRCTLIVKIFTQLICRTSLDQQIHVQGLDSTRFHISMYTVRQPRWRTIARGPEGGDPARVPPRAPLHCAPNILPHFLGTNHHLSFLRSPPLLLESLVPPLGNLARERSFSEWARGFYPAATHPAVLKHPDFTSFGLGAIHVKLSRDISILHNSPDIHSSVHGYRGP